METENDERNIPTLEYLCFEPIFNEMVYKVTPKNVQFVRDLIDNHLVGRVKNNFRKKCIAKLNEIFDLKFGLFSSLFDESVSEETNQMIKKYNKDISVKEKDALEEFAPLNCALDENFEELTIQTPIPVFNSFLVLISIITERSPNLRELCISFCDTSYDLINNISSELVISQDARLPCLTSLSFYYNNFIMASGTYEDPFSGHHQSILSVVGKYCPNLTKLSATFGFPLKKKDLLGLILGEKIRVITNDERWNQDSILEELQIPPELLNPLCFTIQELVLQSSGNHSSLSTSVCAFALRNLPKLRKIDMNNKAALMKILKIIHNVKEKGNQHHQTEFEEFCKFSAFGKTSITTPVQFTSFLLMEELNFVVPIDDFNLVRAVVSLCPNLKKICFREEFDSKSRLHSLLNDDECTTSSGENILPPADQLTLILRGLLKVENVSLSKMSIMSTNPVLDVLGAALKSLDLYRCCSIDMGQLGFCSKMERLSIVKSPINSEDVEAASNWTSDTFLPLLTHFRTNACLGVWAPLLVERKCRLVDLSLDCCHIATDACNPRLEWIQIPELWTNIESMVLRQCSGLTISTILELISRLNKLRCITLPETILRGDTELMRAVADLFLAEQKRSVEITEWRCDYPDLTVACHFQPIIIPEV